MEVELDAHAIFLHQQLEALIPDDSLASHVLIKIGEKLHSLWTDWAIQEEAFPDELDHIVENTPDESSSDNSAWVYDRTGRIWRPTATATEQVDIYCETPFTEPEAIFLWIAARGGLNPRMLADQQGHLLSDDDAKIPQFVKRSLSGAEQLAAYGLWWITKLDSLGHIPRDVRNRQGYARTDVIEHRARCLLNAYQSLTYANRLHTGYELTSGEFEKLERAKYFSEMGTKGSKVRHNNRRILKEWICTQYTNGLATGKWRNPSQASGALVDLTRKRAKLLTVKVSDDDAALRRLIYEKWLLPFQKKSGAGTPVENQLRFRPKHTR